MGEIFRKKKTESEHQGSKEYSKEGRIESFIRFWSSRSKAWRAAIMSLVVAVVFITTYGLILPAITIEKDAAKKMPGIHLESDSSHDEEQRTSGEKVSEASDKKKEESDEAAATDEGADQKEKVTEETGTGSSEDDRYLTEPLVCHVPNYDVSLSMDEEAHIPEGTSLVLKMVSRSSQNYKTWEESLTKRNANLKPEAFFEIKLVKDGKEIRPDQPVDLTFTRSKEADHGIDYGVYFRDGKKGLKAHLITPEYILKDNNKSDSKREAGTQILMKKVALNKKHNLSVIGLSRLDEETKGEVSEKSGEGKVADVKPLTYPAKTFRAKTGKLDISVEAPEGALPKGTTMRVREVSTKKLINSITETVEESGEESISKANSGSSQDKKDKNKKKADSKKKEVKKVYAVDITFTDKEGNEIEPVNPVRVTMSSKIVRDAAADKDKEIAAVHYDDAGEGSLMDIETAKDAVSFDAESFSVYALVEYTVDFEYEVDGKTYQFSMKGGEKIALSELIKVLGILDDTNKGEKSAFNSVDAFLKEVANVEFSDESLVKVTKNEEGNDWTLESLQPFTSEENLTITMKNGDVVTVKVTDDQVTTSTNLSDFLTNASIAAPVDSDGKYLITPETSYDIALTFAENKGLQFDNNAELTYDLSQSGMNFSGLAQNGKFSIKVNDGGTFYTLSNNTFSIDENGHMTLRFDTSDPHFSNLAASNNTRFTVNLDAKINSNTDKIVFKDGIEKEVKVDTSNSVSASKSATFNKETGKVDYTVAVVSQGVSTNVVVKDTITGAALALDASSIHASSSTGQPVIMTGGAHGNSFEYTIGSMKNGEIVTFTYSADIDMSQIHNVNGKYVTTGNNRVEVKSDGDPEPDVVNRTTTIDYTPTVNKSNGTIVEDNGDTKTLSWTITANEDCKVSMAGGTITDTIGSASQSIMKYSGTGIKVDVYDASGTKVREDNKLWSDLTNKTDSTWTYTVPTTDAGKAYKYVITYTTDVSVKGKTGSTVVDNSVTTDGGKTSSGQGNVPAPPGGDVKVEKTVDNIDLENNEVSWTISFNVPADGLTKAVVTDIYPNMGVESGMAFEKIIPGSLHITGLRTDLGESYKADHNVNTTGDSYYVQLGSVITFYTDSDKTQEGLQGLGARTITISLKTEINEEWVAASRVDDWRKSHKNEVKLDANGNVTKDDATALISAPNLKKDASFYGTRTENGVDYPVYRYVVRLDNVTSGINVIEDTYDTSLLKPYNEPQDAFYLGYGNEYNAYSGWFTDTPASYVETTTGMTITTNDQAIAKKDDGSYYPAYWLYYYLTVKDEAALKTIMGHAIANDNGKYTMSNTADWNGITDGADVEYEYVGLDKEILTSEDELKKSDEDIWADFRITLNPGGMMLNGGEPLNVTDTITNLSIDYNSIVATPSEGVTWDQTDSVTTFTIPDETKVVITYRARVLFKTIGENGSTIKVDFRNVAQMDGYRDEISGSGERHNSGGGVASVPVINLLKYRAGSMNEPLSGAVFALLDKDKNPVTWGKAYGDHKVGDPVQFTTGSDGKIHVRGDQANYGWALDEDTRYYLREITAPEGYMLADFDYSFKISSDGTTDYSDPEWKYHTGDTMSAKNYPGTDVQVNKVWSDGNDKHSTDTVTVKLQQRLQTGTDSETGEATWGRWSDTIRMEDSSDHYAWKDFTGKTITLKEDSGWSGTFTGLPLVVPSSLTEASEDVEVQYQVVETLVNDEAPEVGTVAIGQSKNGGAYVFTVNNTVKETTVDVVKVDKTTPSKKLPGAKFTVRKLDENDGVPVPLSSGEFSGTEVTGSPIITSAQGEASIGNLTHGYYELREKEAPNGYVLTSTAPQYFKVEGGAVTWIEWSATANKWIDKSTDEMVTFEAAQVAVVDNPDTTEVDESKAATNATFEVKNEPGVALPSTGGPGTRLFIILGSILVLGAGLLMWRRRRTI